MNLIFAEKKVMTAYEIFLSIHSILRWVVLVLAAIVVIKSMMGMFGKPKYAKADNIMAASYVGLMDLQLLLGLILYIFLSPVTSAAFQDFGAAMSNPELRFWAVEHLTIMIIAVALAHIGRSRSKKKADYKAKFRIQGIFFAISFVLMMLGIPWDRFQY